MNDLLACPNSSTTLRVHLFTSCNLADVFTDQAAETSATPHGAVVAQARLPRARVRPARDHGGAGSRCNGERVGPEGGRAGRLPAGFVKSQYPCPGMAPVPMRHLGRSSSACHRGWPGLRTPSACRDGLGECEAAGLWGSKSQFSGLIDAGR